MGQESSGVDFGIPLVEQATQDMADVAEAVRTRNIPLSIEALIAFLSFQWLFED